MKVAQECCLVDIQGDMHTARPTTSLYTHTKELKAAHETEFAVPHSMLILRSNMTVESKSEVQSGS